MESKNILITGAAGFIGYFCATALKRRGDGVIGFDNFNAYYSPILKRERSRLLAKEGVTIIEGDLCDKELLMELFKEHKFTHVLHLAAQAGVRYALKFPNAYLKSNIEGFLSLLEILREVPKTELIYASSSSVYGKNEKIPFSIMDQTDRPANLYAATKKANELMAYSYHNLFRIPMTGLRFFTVYGPWGRPDMAYFSFTKSILEETPIYLFNEGKMERDFTYIDDIVGGVIAAIDQKERTFDLFNLGNNHPVPVLEMIGILENLLKKKAVYEMGPTSAGEVAITYADISDAEKRLGYRPTIRLEEGLSRFLDWYTHSNS
ncbi:MAG: NAD-dependent epimerase/dehydratase family protein [Chlamydiia bacterium]|nr:NAD-dependent epimerase/dehydratase family protein [Chlamydiia bacterium]